VWAKAQQKLKQNPHNRKIFETIEKALLVVCLEDSSPSGVDDFGCIVAAGDASNRYFDKVLQVIIFQNGRVGLNGEHTPFDALTIGSMISEGLSKFYRKEALPSYRILSSPQHLEFQSLQELKPQLVDAEKHWKELSGDMDFHVEIFRDYGSERIKKDLHTSPDAFIQMALQLAYYKMYKKGTPTYETGTTRAFYHGRTETVRTFSVDTAEFTKSMDSKDISNSNKLQLLQKALKSHLHYMGDATKGKGCDRHLMGMKILALQEGTKMPAIFTNKAYSDSLNYRLSTSNIGGYNFYWGGFGNVVPDGYGVCYRPRDDLIYFTIVCRHSCPTTNSLKLGAAITQSLREMWTLCTTATAKL